MNDVLFHSPTTVFLILKLIHLHKANQISVQLQYVGRFSVKICDTRSYKQNWEVGLHKQRMRKKRKAFFSDF